MTGRRRAGAVARAGQYRGGVRRYRFALGPSWWGLHLFTVAIVITMIFLGRWQLHVSQSKHFDLQNFGYSIQWWLFSAFALFFWSRLVRDGARRRAGITSDVPAAPAAGEPVAYRRYVPPAVTAAGADPVRAAYNDYLAELAKKDAT